MNTNNSKVLSALDLLPVKRVKTSLVQFDSYQVGANSFAFSDAIEIGDDIKSISICGFQGSSTDPDDTCSLEAWPGDDTNASSFVSPVAVGVFSSGLLYMGSIPNDSRFLKLKIINAHTSSRSYTVKLFMST